MREFRSDYGVFIYLIGMLIVSITGIIIGISMFLEQQVIIDSWYSVPLFATMTLLWIIPVQLINGLKLIPIQRRWKRVLFPYVLAMIQISAYVLYTVALNVLISGVKLSEQGLIIFVITTLVYAKVLKDKLARENERLLLKEQSKH